MCKAKNNHCVMRKHSRAASGASSEYMQEGGGRNGEGGRENVEGGGAISGMDSCRLQLLSNTDCKGQSSLYFRHFNFKKKIFIRTDA